MWVGVQCGKCGGIFRVKMLTTRISWGIGGARSECSFGGGGGEKGGGLNGVDLRVF